MGKYKFFILIFLVTSLFSQNVNAPVEDTNKGIDITNLVQVSLIDVVLETAAQSYNVKAAREKVRQARIKVDDAYSGYLPSIDGTYKQSRVKAKPGDEKSERKFYNDESYKLSVTQNLYTGGATYHDIKSLEKKYEAAKNDYRTVIAKEIENAIKAYFDVLFNYQSLMINTENMDRLNEILEIVNTKYTSGATSLGDLSNIKASVSNAQSKLIKIQSKFNEALDYYKYIVGDDFATTFPFEDKFDTTIADFELIVEKALENNLKLKNYKLNIKSEKYKLLSSKAGFKPKVDLELSSEKVNDQEDFETVERNYVAKVIVSYNFYNKGKDKNKILMINSMIREMDYRLQEEIRKLEWTLSKLHTSIQSVTNASISTKAEVLASQEMVNSYWDGFKLGEQDLQELLQGQRQLNSAQLDLVKNKKSAITDYFKLLSHIGELSAYFRLDIEKDNFIDFSRSDYKSLRDGEKKPKKEDIKVRALAPVSTVVAKKETEVALPAEEKQNTQETQENSVEMEKTAVNGTLNVEKTNSINELVAYQDTFLKSDENKWTIRIYYFDKVYKALDFANKKNINNKIFVFNTLQSNKVKTNIAYNIFDTKELAQIGLDKLNITEKNTQLTTIKKIKALDKKFKNKKLQQKVKPKKIKPFQTNQKFKKEFLEAPADKYTINITSFSSILDAKNLLQQEKISDNSFVFTYGEENEWVKVMYGVYETYDEASVALNKLKNIKVKYEPIIETIKTKQQLYQKYNRLKKN